MLARVKHQWAWGVICGVMAASAVAVAVDQGALGSLSSTDQRRVEGIKEWHGKQIERATERYQSAVERANDRVTAVYESVMRDYERQGETAVVQALKADLKMTLSRSADASVMPKADKDASMPGENTKIRGHIDLMRKIGPVLMTKDEKKVSTKVLGSCQYVVLYFSAHWCGPCRAFTPKLAKFYRDHQKGSNFQIVFVSSDRSERDMFKYMQEADMPWLSLPYDQIREANFGGKYGIRGIPGLVMLDHKGETVATGRGDVMQKLEREFR